MEEDTSSLPLPTLLKPELKHGKKPLFDLMEAIREIKVRSSELLIHFFFGQRTFDPYDSFCVCMIPKA